MIRVLQVLPALTYCGGIEAYLLNYYRHLDYQRVNFDFITHGEVLPEIRQEIESCGGRVFQANPISFATLRPLSHWIWQFLQEHAREYAAIHCHMANAGFLYFPLAQAAGIRVCILHSHNNRAAAVWSHAVRNMPLIRMGNACATHRVACSEEAGRFLFGSLPFEQIRNAIDVQSFLPNDERRAQVRRQLGMEQACIIGHVGRLDPQKNQMFLLHVFAELRQRYQDAELVLLGDGSQKAMLQETSRRLGIAEHVHFLGVLSNIADYYQAMDVFCFPSRYEGLGMVLVEAQCAGLPIVAAGDAIPHQVNLGGVQFLSLQDTYVRWADAVRTRAQEPRRSYAAEAREAGYDIRLAAEQLMAYYEHACLSIRGGQRGSRLWQWAAHVLQRILVPTTRS